MSSLAREAHALGLAAGRASPDQGEALPIPPPLMCRHNGPGAQRVTIVRECQCGDFSQVDVTDIVLRSPPPEPRGCSCDSPSPFQHDVACPAAPPPEYEGPRAEARLKAALREAIGIAEWMSGSPSFSRDGEAGYGWRKAQIDLERLGVLLAPSSAKEGGRHE